MLNATCLIFSVKSQRKPNKEKKEEVIDTPLNIGRSRTSGIKTVPYKSPDLPHSITFAPNTSDIIDTSVPTQIRSTSPGIKQRQRIENNSDTLPPKNIEHTSPSPSPTRSRNSGIKRAQKMSGSLPQPQKAEEVIDMPLKTGTKEFIDDPSKIGSKEINLPSPTRSKSSGSKHSQKSTDSPRQNIHNSSPANKKVSSKSHSKGKNIV